ncbi:glycosyltransferase family A protein [Spirulina sp. CCNP1310]|uniref:glycosyltransferase family 2 protein n=1 Tax=Spirulina sp. CCNP1310 TaxID=3110249 RepID=UPI002B2009E3|nr:glycosyltransferase family A protein [Spirulina sp. CCNP1310]
MPKVSIIIPTYNRASALKRCLNSLTFQTFQDFEVLVCDDGSTDDTEEVVNSFLSRLTIKYYWSENSGGPAKPRNIGIAQACGKYLAFLDSDDWWKSQKLEKSVHALEAGANFVYHDLYIMPSSWTQSRIWNRTRVRQLVAPVFEDLLLNGSAICNSSVVVRREIMENIQGFSEDTKLIAAEDYDAWLRVSKLTDAFVRLPDCLGYYTVGADNISSANRSIMNINRLLEIHGKEIKEQHGKIPGWMSYTLASSYYKKKVFDKSQIYALYTIKEYSCIDLKVRSVFITVLISLRSIFIH